MKLRHPLHEFMPYGAPDLLQSGRAHLSRALVVSTGSAALAFVALVLAIPLIPNTPIAIVRDVSIPTHTPLPPVETAQRAVTPRVQPAAPKVPVANAPVNPVKDEAKTLVDPGTGRGPGGAAATTSPSFEGPSGPPQEDVSVVDSDLPVKFAEVPPYAVTEVKPEYPDIARDAMVEGRVLVLVLVGRDGRVREAKLDEHAHVPLLDAVALEAAKKWVFTPAQSSGHPVAVWSAIPFDFRLQ